MKKTKGRKFGWEFYLVGMLTLGFWVLFAAVVGYIFIVILRIIG